MLVPKDLSLLSQRLINKWKKEYSLAPNKQMMSRWMLDLLFNSGSKKKIFTFPSPLEIRSQENEGDGEDIFIRMLSRSQITC